MPDPHDPAASTDEQLAAVYGSLRRLAAARQPSFQGALNMLDALLEKHGFPHPYTFDDALLADLEEADWFRSAPAGRPAQCPPDRYLYRLTALKPIVEYAGWTFGSVREPLKTIHASLRERHQASGLDWSPLRSYAAGPLRGRFGYTWWTSFEGIVDDPIGGAYRVGVTSNQIPTFALLLRVPTVAVDAAAHVPTVANALTSLIFHPTRERDERGAGLTINVEGHYRVADGVDEYVLGPLDTTRVEFRPVLLDHSAWARYARAHRRAGAANDPLGYCEVCPCPGLFHALEEYYATCGGSDAEPV
ncbi:MAG TPA: hypothetical protein VF746_31210 [Longimicrobium sp.]|jgi:hypothetical protein